MGRLLVALRPRPQSCYALQANSAHSLCPGLHMALDDVASSCPAAVLTSPFPVVFLLSIRLCSFSVRCLLAIVRQLPLTLSVLLIYSMAFHTTLQLSAPSTNDAIVQYRIGEYVPWHLEAKIIVASYFASLMGSMLTVELLHHKQLGKSIAARLVDPCLDRICIVTDDLQPATAILCNVDGSYRRLEHALHW